MISCEETSRLLSDSLDRQLSLPERMGLRLHLLMCRFCRRFSHQMKFMREVVNGYREEIEGKEPFTAPSLSLDAREKIRLAVADKSKA